MYKSLLILSIILALIACQQAPQKSAEPEVAYLNPEGAGDRPFTEVVRVGNLLFLSGKLGTISGQGLVEGGIQAETRQALENIKAALEHNGSSLDHVVKATVFLADIAEWSQMNEVYVTFFPNNKPARSAVGTGDGLARGARVEIEVIATVAPLGK